MNTKEVNVKSKNGESNKNEYNSQSYQPDISSKDQIKSGRLNNQNRFILLFMI